MKKELRHLEQDILDTNTIMRLRNEADERNDRLKASVDTTSVLVDGGYGFGDFMDVLFGSSEETKSIRRRSIIAAKEKRASKAGGALRLNPLHSDFTSDLPYLTVGFHCIREA